MRGEQKRTGDDEERPFVGVPSDQVGRGSGQDPPDARGEDEEDCAVIQVMRDEAMAEHGEAEVKAERSKKRSETSEGDANIAASPRPPSDS